MVLNNLKWLICHKTKPSKQFYWIMKSYRPLMCCFSLSHISQHFYSFNRSAIRTYKMLTASSTERGVRLLHKNGVLNYTQWWGSNSNVEFIAISFRCTLTWTHKYIFSVPSMGQIDLFENYYYCIGILETI